MAGDRVWSVPRLTGVPDSRFVAVRISAVPRWLDNLDELIGTFAGTVILVVVLSVPPSAVSGAAAARAGLAALGAISIVVSIRAAKTGLAIT